MRIIALILGCALAGATFAQGYPNRPLQMFHGFLVGGNPDIISRLIAPALGERLGQTVVVEPRPGASGRIATAHVAKQPADGYTMIMITGGDAVLAATARDLPYDLLRDLAFASSTTRFPFLFAVAADSPYKTLRDLIEDARKRPGKLTYGTSGIASTLHLAGELFKDMAGIDLLHVPFKGEQVREIVAGRLDLAVTVATPAMALIKAGKVRVLAHTGPDRLADLPEAQPIREELPGYEVLSWLGLALPGGTPAAIVERVSAELRAVLAREDVKTRLLSLGSEPYPATPAEFRARVEADVAKWKKLAAKVKLD